MPPPLDRLCLVGLGWPVPDFARVEFRRLAPLPRLLLRLLDPDDLAPLELPLAEVFDPPDRLDPPDDDFDAGMVCVLP